MELFKITNLVAKVDRMKVIMEDSVDSMESYDFFEDEDIKAKETIEAIKSGDKIIRDYVVEEIIDLAYQSDYLHNEGITYDEAVLIAKYLIQKEDN